MLMKVILFSLLFAFLMLIPVHFVFADEILITKSGGMDKIIFDGKMTSGSEWSRSSENIIHNSPTIYLRSAHQEENVYFMINSIGDTTYDSGFDKAIICFDSENNKSVYLDSNDYCFISSLGDNSGIVLQEGSNDNAKNHFSSLVLNSFQTSSGFSDENDRYSSKSYVGYEFKIPTDIIGRNHTYGFFIAVYDHSNEKIVTWPNGIEMDNINNIPSPSMWGALVSPDKSLPEFSFSYMMLALIPGMIIVYFLTNRKIKLNYF